MILHRHAREFYTLTITTDPPITGGWEASFDAGQTWVPGEPAGASWRWLLAGTQAPTDQPCTIVTRSVSPLVRAIDHPEIVVRAAPTVYVTW